MALTFFIGGIIQGSLRDTSIHAQNYRQLIGAALRRRFPEADIVDPVALHPNSVDYGPEEGKRTLLALAEAAAQADVVIAYVPQASMGTAIEMWQAHRAGVPVLTISPMSQNWVVRFLSARVFPTLEEFEAFVAGGGVERILEAPARGT